ncbi:hypothetical protein ACIQXU_16670 [Peribacillus sp. NPDC097284]|uniref:hypothetical protein n=1 Tax=Peribacillus sp. NPDC097284 TaxID=3364401 RepID=UPI00382BC6E8
MGKFEKILNAVFWVLSGIFTLSGVMFYTTEYSGTDDKVGPIKRNLDKEYSFSLLMIILIVILFLYIIIGIFKLVFSVSKKEILKQVEIKLINKKEKNDSDKETINQVEALLSVNFMMNFFKKKDFGMDSFCIDDIHIIHDFLDESINPKLKFLDENLEQKRNLLVVNMAEFSELLKNNNEQIGNSNLWRIPRKSRASVIQSVNKYSEEIWKLYEQIISNIK